MKLSIEENKEERERVRKFTSSFIKNQINNSKSMSDSNSVSVSSSSKVVRLFKGGESPLNEMERENFSADYVEKRKREENKDKIDLNPINMFPSFESDERDENVPRLWNQREEQSVSDDSIEDVINIKIFTYRRNLLVKEYIFDAHDNYMVMHSAPRFKQS